MTRNDIIRMARDAGFIDADQDSVWITDGFWTQELKRFAALVAAAEREAIADELEHGFEDGNGFHAIYARAIRERSNP